MKGGLINMAKELNEDMRHETYSVQQNVAGTGRIMDTITTRHITEAVIAVIGIITVNRLIFHLPLLVSGFVYAFAGILCIVPYGINAEPLSVFIGLKLKSAFYKRTYRRYVHFKKERKEQRNDS